MVGAKVCDLTEDLLWFIWGLNVGILTSSLIYKYNYCRQFNAEENLCANKRKKIDTSLLSYN